MTNTTQSDRQIISQMSNQASEYILGVPLLLTPDIWDRTGATIAISETFSESLNKLFTSWSNVSNYRAQQYIYADRLILDTEVQIGRLSNGAAPEAAALRRSAQVIAENMRIMGDLAASDIPLSGSSAANAARAAEFTASFAKAAGSLLTIGQMASATYNAATGQATTHDVMAAAAGNVGALAAGIAVGAGGALLLGSSTGLCSEGYFRVCSCNYDSQLFG